jgi:hypothetical protein
MHEDKVLLAHTELELTKRLEKWHALDVSNSTTELHQMGTQLSKSRYNTIGTRNAEGKK